ncbi:Hypothetical predicted protein [Mytilus galloprovincialis]|uniref:Novel STAND NTPase 3 domain-containing protein n=1 Tax=Mytilus galloprovincialis TaxID=29158 RepID=A0A8B6G770_MYTGA|nr:Hypothetical predicted protein [Mytilus galloprovincialis]
MASTDISHVSEEEENYLRLHLLLTGISPRAVRVLFDNEFHPTCLEASIKKEYGKLYDLKKKHVINAAQWNLLFPSSATAWVYNQRVKDVPYDLGIITNEAVRRIGGQHMEEECKELRSKHLDQSTVPWNIRGKDTKVQISKILDQWQKNDGDFVETSAAKQVLECAQENSCVTITASSGVGKTATLQHVVLKMAEEGYDVLLVTNPQDIVKFYNPNQKTLFVIDDFCGTYSINQSDLLNWEPYVKRIEKLIQNKLTKIIVACRLQVYKDEKFDSLSIFKANVCNLLSEDLCLSKTEKRLIAEMYLGIEASDIIEYSDLFDCFPLLCKLHHDNHQLNISNFFQNPFLVYEAEIDQLKRNGCFSKYCALALCVMFNNELEEKVLTDEMDTNTRAIIENTFEACRLDKGTSRLILLDELDSLEHTFIKKEYGIYKTVHDKLFDFLSYYFGKTMIQCLIKNAHSQCIMERFLLEKEKNMDQFVTIVPPKYIEMYMQRMVKDWSNGKVVNVFCNNNMTNRKFRNRYLCYLNTLDILYQRQLAHTCDIDSQDTVILQCCFICDIPLIQWCLYHGVDVNRCRYDGGFASSQLGHTEVVQLLLDNKADIDKCKDDEISSLVIACQLGYTDIVQLLLDHKADINKCRADKTFPLYMACQQNRIDIVKLLIYNQADINKCTDKGSSPLFISCYKGCTDIVKLLLDNKSDINKCTDNRISPLLMACQENHVDIVKLLLDNKADMNKCKEPGLSPLYIACQDGYTDIVKLLLDNKADINKCRDDGTSPLYIACANNHSNIVQLLLDNKADINKCLDDGTSPLYIACENNHSDIVQLLLDNKADLNKCLVDETSPLLRACQEGYANIVQLLLSSKIDINKCRNDETSALFIACQNNHAGIVKMLLDNKADVNKCTDEGTSPLLKACHEGNKNIVQLLLDSKADINKCSNNGISPLNIACFENRVDIVHMLLDNKAHINKCISKDSFPLFIACQKNHVDIVRLLLDKKAGIDECLDNGSSPLYIACENNHENIVQLLLENKADINKSKNDGTSPLFIACAFNHVKIVKLLLDNKADITNCRNDEVTPLFIACGNNHKDTVKLLLENMADIDKCNINGLSPIFIASGHGYIDIVQILIEKGANYNKCASLDGVFYSPKQIAREQGYNDIVALISEHSRKYQFKM